MNATTKKTVVGVDTAKNVFQVYTVDQKTGEVINKPIKRGQFLQWFANRAPCLIGMEACGGSQHWARKLQELGHEVKLMGGKMVKAFVCGNKNDAADARAIYMAAQQPEIKAVAVKTEDPAGDPGIAPHPRGSSEGAHGDDQRAAWSARGVRRSVRPRTESVR